MKNIRHKRSFPLNKLAIMVSVCIVLIGTYGGAGYFFKLWPFSDNRIQEEIILDAPTQQPANASDQDANTKTNNITPSDGIPSGEPDNIVISTRRENDILVVSTKLYGYSDGTCDLNISDGTQTSSYSAEIIFQSEYSTCAGFSIKVSDHGAGTWNLELNVTSKGQTNSKQVQVSIE